MKVDTTPSGQGHTTIRMNGKEVMQAICSYAIAQFGTDIPDGEHKLILPNTRPVHPDDDFTLTVVHEAP